MPFLELAAQFNCDTTYHPGPPLTVCQLVAALLCVFELINRYEFLSVCACVCV